MVQLVLVYLLLFWTAVVYSQQSKTTTNPTISAPSVWEYVLHHGSKSLVAGLQSDSDYKAVSIALAQPNITFFLPTESAIASAVNTSALNFTNTNTTRAQLLRHLVLQVHDLDSLLRARQYLSSNDSSTASHPLVVGPSPKNQLFVQVSSGISTAYVVNSTQCSNGIIHQIDQFLGPPLPTMGSIEQIDDLQTHEMLMKSLNLTTVVSGPNKTVLAPINQAWDAANSSTMPYGTLVHALKYQVIDGIYLLDALYSDTPTQNISLLTLRRNAYLRFERSANNELLVIGRRPTDVARIVRSDVITTEGVIHLVDKVLPADLDEDPIPVSDCGNDLLAATPTGTMSAQSSDQSKSSATIAVKGASSLLSAALLIGCFFF